MFFIRNHFLAIPLLAGLLTATAAPVPLRAETRAVRVAFGEGLPHLPSYIVMERKLLEKYTQAAGLPPATLKQVHIVVGRDLLLTGDTELVAGGGTSMMSIWDKTTGAQEVRGVIALCDMNFWLLTSDPNIKTLADYKSTDRIASGIKTSIYALALQVAATKEFGPAQKFKFDALSVQLSNPEAMGMVLSGKSEVRSMVVPPPFNAIALQSGKTHEVMNASQYLGRVNGAVLYTNRKFVTENPKTYAAVVAAYQEAIQFIRQNKLEAAKIYLKYEPIKQDPEWIEKQIADPDTIDYTAVPHGFRMFADFWEDSGLLTKKYTSWQDFFWDNEKDVKDGS